MRPLSLLLGLIVVVGCASGGARPASSTTAPQSAANATPPDTTGGIGPQYASTYQRHPNPPVLIRNATIMTATGQEIQGGSILLRDGKIVAVG
ncbi:MAG TPA: hypothetical protein VN513_14770, partial [Gemmatimonadales bacterium]|nr:hypothetical protein [Gemmatimonadales bacterium]